MRYLQSKRRWLLLPAIVAMVMVVFLAFASQTPKASATNTVSNGWKLVGTYTDKGTKSAGQQTKLINVTGIGGKNLNRGDRVILISGDVNNGTQWIVVVKTPKVPKAGMPNLLGNLVFLRHMNAGDACGTLAAPAGAAGQVWSAPCGAPAPTGPLSGVSDIMVTNAGKTADAYHCISYTAQDAASNLVKTSAECFDNTGVLALLSPSGGEPPSGSVPGEGPDAGPGLCPAAPCGPPPPPPYTNGDPAQGNGTYTPGTDTLVNTTCFADAGASGNIISTLTIAPGTDSAHPTQGAVAQLTNNGKQVGTVTVFLHQTIAQCDTLTPAGPDQLALPITNVYPVNNANCPGGVGGCVLSPFRIGHSLTDYDGDGCTDAQELNADKSGATAKCGDSPWNPYDSGTDATGTYDVLAIATRAWAASGPGTPGFYYECVTDIQNTGPPVGSATPLAARLVCYIDSPGFTINPHEAANSAVLGVSTCGGTGAAAKYCGDGYSGAMPPGCNPGAIAPDTCANHLPPKSGASNPCPTLPLPCDTSVWQFANITNKQTKLTGILDVNPGTNQILIAGCFEDPQLINPLGPVYVQAAINLHTGDGFVLLWAAQTPANCIAGTPAGGIATAGTVPVFIVKQAPGPKTGATATFPYGCIPNAGPGYSNCRDSNGSGCPDKMKLSDTQTQGGLRDPLNRWDYFNPERVNTPHAQTAADILKVVQAFGHNMGMANYDSAFDRTGLIGGNAWNLGPPDGKETAADILAAVKQFGHNC